MAQIQTPFRTVLCQRRKQWSTVALLVIFVLTYTVYVNVDIFNSTTPSASPATSRYNYFMDGDEYLPLGFVVRTPACSILNISAYDKALLPLLAEVEQPRNCSSRNRNRNWTYTKNANLIMNLTAIHESGYPINSVSCCHQSIQRVHQSPDHFDEFADSKIEFSKECKPMNVITPLNDELIRVYCSYKYWPFFMDVVYRNFHVAALPHRSSTTIDKVRYWRDRRRDVEAVANDKDADSIQNPPNVLLIGIDSVSRLSFQRNMKKTRRVLQEIGAVEMLGYTKVGENTFPNGVAFMTGYLEDDIKRLCFFSSMTPFDACPFMWAKFGEAKYLTAYLEDAPRVSAYNYFKTGFVVQPTDYYLRPLMLAVHAHDPDYVKKWTIDCIGCDGIDDTILKYIDEMQSMSSTNATPLFLFSWFTNLAHGDFSGAQFGDDSYARFLQNLDLSNTILFFMSDHGYRFGTVRETFPGWYEDKLPNLWVYLPENIRDQHPTWMASLHTNSQRLTSPFDLYKSLEHILTTFTSVEKFSNAKTPNGTELPRKYGFTLFDDVPATRNCPKAGIPDNDCACGIPRKLKLDDERVVAATNKAIRQINERLPVFCAPLALRNITAAAIMYDLQEKKQGDDATGTYVVAFDTLPGDFLFEATVIFDDRQKTYEVAGDLLRMNRINKDHVTCVKNAVLERFCFCSL